LITEEEIERMVSEHLDEMKTNLAVHQAQQQTMAAGQEELKREVALISSKLNTVGEAGIGLAAQIKAMDYKLDGFMSRTDQQVGRIEGNLRDQGKEHYEQISELQKTYVAAMQSVLSKNTTQIWIVAGGTFGTIISVTTVVLYVMGKL